MSLARPVCILCMLDSLMVVCYVIQNLITFGTMFLMNVPYEYVLRNDYYIFICFHLFTQLSNSL